MHLLFWLIDGIAVGLLGQLARGFKRNRAMNLAMGTTGAVAGGFFVFVSPFFVHGETVFSNLGAVLGAAILISLSGYLGARREYNATLLQRTFYMDRSKSPRMPAIPSPRQLAYARNRKD